MTFQRRLIEAAVAAALLIPGAALAQPPAPTGSSAKVAYSDLDLGSDAGAQAMLGRIRKAAVEVCRSQPEGGSSADVMARFESCRRDTVARAVKQLGSPSVQAAYEARPIRLA
jgi:UrcA family protein